MKSNHGMNLPVILDLLKTFAFETRILRNPYYDEIWTSIKNRVFDLPTVQAYGKNSGSKHSQLMWSNDLGHPERVINFPNTIEVSNER